MLEIVRKQILACVCDWPIVSVTLKPLEFGDNYVLPLSYGKITMAQQIVLGLEMLNADTVFFCEDDVLYHKSHFAFDPPSNGFYWYNLNVWRVHATTGHALHYLCHQASQLCGGRERLLKHYEKRLDAFYKAGECRDNVGYEPGVNRWSRKLDGIEAKTWWSEYPNVDIRHRMTQTASKWRQDQFNKPESCQGWMEADSVPGWGKTEGRFKEFLNGIAQA